MDEPVLLVLWERTVGELLDRTASFPKAARFAFAARIDGLALDILEALVDARWASGARKRAALLEADLGVSRLLVLLRLSHDRRYLSTPAFEHLVRSIDEAGRMLGGWRRHLDKPEGG